MKRFVLKKAAVIIIAAMVLIVVCAGCPGQDSGSTGGTTPGTPGSTGLLGGTITQPTTWKAGSYSVSASVYVESVLTIEPGTVLLFAPGTRLEIGIGGSIIARGSGWDATKRILFDSAKTIKAKGDYNGIVVQGNGCVFEYCEFRHAEFGLTVQNTGIDVRTCIFDSNTTGIDSSSATKAVSVRNTQFSNNEEPLSVNEYFNADDGSNVFTGNVNQRIFFWDDKLAANSSWAETEVPYWIHNTVYLGKVLTLAPGVRFLFDAGTGLTVEDTGSLSAKGSMAARIMFDSGKAIKAKGDYNGIFVQGNGCVFEYCDFSHAASALTIRKTDTTLADCAFRSNTIGIDYSSSGGWDYATKALRTIFSDNDTDTQGP